MALADVVTIESNHDPVLLSQSQRAESLKRRISGPRGHLSNDDAAKLVRRFASQRLKRVYLAHLSDECNAPHIAERTMRETLAEIGRGDVELTVI
jgi:phosphoribosyl 1,2-cyclic phosphodiesterase